MNISSLQLSPLAGKTVLVTGATGLIGSSLVHTLLNAEVCQPVTILALVRSPEKAQRILGNHDNLQLLVGDVTQPLSVPGKIDYIIHAASQTASRAFVEEPVETILTALNGTRNILELAKEKQVSGFVYLSSMEVYGAPATDEKITEEHNTNLNTMSVRSSYPESKRMCEALCAAYASEYQVPACVLRLTQTFGPGVSYSDGRVFAEFARCAIEGRDIVLHTKGETRRNYLYTQDAVSAILTVLLKGTPGEAYNAANEDTYCSIYEMAQLAADQIAEGSISVKIEIEEESKFGYAPVLRMNLDTGKLRALGWQPQTGLSEMFQSLIADLKENKR